MPRKWATAPLAEFGSFTNTMGNIIHRAHVPTLCAGLSLMLAAAVLLAAVARAAPQAIDNEKKPKNRALRWKPPALDAQVRGLISSPPCELSTVLAQAGERASDLIDNLQNFTAQEKVAYQSFDREGLVKDAGTDVFDYIVIFHRAPGPIVEEKRNAKHGSSSAVATQGRGLPEMVLIFLPNLQDDYEMKCEGRGEWEGQPAWVLHFQQRPDKANRTFSFRGFTDEYSASLKGHAWIAADSGEVIHLEVGLMHEIAPVKVHQWYLSIDYAPVRFTTRDARLWLPESADSYLDLGDLRLIVYHTFSDFLLFSVETEQKIEKPKIP